MTMFQEEHQQGKRRRDAGNLQVTERDVASLTWIAEQFCISFDQLRRLLGRQPKAATKEMNVLSAPATRDIILRWLQLGLIEEPRKLFSGYPPHLWLSRRGLTRLDLPYPYYEPKPTRIPHLYATNAIRLHLESYGLQSLWYAHRRLIRETELRPQPDAEFRTGGIPIIAIEVIERHHHFESTLQDAIHELTTLALRQQDNRDRYTHLWYFLHAETIPIFRRALSKLDQQVQERVRLYGLDAQEVTQ
jgi:hypothetical protein